MIQKQAKLMKGDKVVGGGYLLGGSTGDVYLDLGGGYMGIYICKNLSSCTFKIWALLSLMLQFKTHTLCMR